MAENGSMPLGELIGISGYVPTRPDTSQDVDLDDGAVDDAASDEGDSLDTAGQDDADDSDEGAGGVNAELASLRAEVKALRPMQGKADQAESDVAKLVALVEELTKGHQNQDAADDDGADDLQVLTRADLKADKAREESRAVQAKQRDAEKQVKSDWDRMIAKTQAEPDYEELVRFEADNKLADDEARLLNPLGQLYRLRGLKDAADAKNGGQNKENNTRAKKGRPPPVPGRQGGGRSRSVAPLDLGSARSRAENFAARSAARGFKSA